MVATRLFTFGVAATFACVAVASPEGKNLLARQDDDNDADDIADRECHANCGYTIADAQGSTPSSYCSNQTWVDQLNRCLACTNREDDDDVWEDYGRTVSNVAQACGGQNATPGAVLSTASATGTASMTTLTGTATGAATAPTSVTDCHTHGDDLFCVVDGAEWEVTSDINMNNAPDSFDNCRWRGDDGDDLTCVMDNGNEVELEREGADHTTGTATAPTSVTDCHTHGDDLFCTADGVEWEVTSDINVNNAPDSYSNCQASGDDDNDITCEASDGSRVELEREGAGHSHGTSTTAPTGTTTGSPSNTSGAAGGASQSSETATQDGSSGRVGGSSVGGLAGLVLAVLAL